MGNISTSASSLNGNSDLRVKLDALAEERYARVVASGKSISWKQMRRYLIARLAGKVVERPVARMAD